MHIAGKLIFTQIHKIGSQFWTLNTVI